MRIALLAHCRHPIAEPYQGGLEMHTALLADGLVARGHDVLLLAKDGSRTRAELLPLVPAGPLAGPPLDAAHDAALRAVVPELDADVILNNSLSPVPYAWFDDRPVLTALHTPASLEPVCAVVDNPGWRPHPRHVWAGVSQTTCRDWSSRLPAVRHLPNGVDLAHWAPRLTARPRPRRAVWSGRITPEKGLVVAIEAARLAGFSLSISGPVADPDYFRTEIVPRLDHRTRYVGHLCHRELPGFLQSGEVYVFSPLWPEPFGLALVEALAGGTPAAVLPHGAVAEIVTPAGGVIAAAATAEALAAAMPAAARLPRGAVAASVAGFDRTIMIERYERLLATMITAPLVATPDPERGMPCR